MILRSAIQRLGHIKTVFLITMISVLLSFSVYLLLIYVLNIAWTYDGIMITLMIPIIVAPIISWYLIKFIFQIMALESKMRNLATVDSLTQLLTRQSFLNHIEPLYELAKRNQSNFTILYLDVDNFKSINDTYGHNIGDKVLQSLGNILKSNKRDSDLVGRLGGEEFAYALPDIEIEGVKFFSEKIRKIIENDIFENNGVVINYTISIGVSIYTQDNKVTLEELIAQADKALYIAKSKGKNCVTLYANEY